MPLIAPHDKYFRPAGQCPREELEQALVRQDDDSRRANGGLDH